MTLKDISGNADENICPNCGKEVGGNELLRPSRLVEMHSAPPRLTQDASLGGSSLRKVGTR
jgi:hypothetical protein